MIEPLQTTVAIGPAVAPVALWATYIVYRLERLNNDHKDNRAAIKALCEEHNLDPDEIYP